MYIAKKAKDVQVELQEAKFASIGELGYLSAKKTNKVKDVVENCPFDSFIEMQDIKLSVPGGYEEDKTYSLNPFLIKNVRRGNTILNFYEDKNDEDTCTKAVIGRKGLNKFFDLKLEYVLRDSRYKDQDLN
jgi:hypothetical protein